ncbi:hypothetical protein [Alteribacillus sp. HJP-4]|uniref:hypothetical protein n=1 Tax=Alteribacillus sp. HJP-4 TaxID=2775394 RepID=UPI0035CD1A56
MKNTNHRNYEKSPGTEPFIGKFYNVDGRRLVLKFAGSGSPVVVFLPAAGMTGSRYNDTRMGKPYVSRTVLPTESEGLVHCIFTMQKGGEYHL